MKVSNNIHNICSLDNVELIEEHTIIEQIPIKPSPVATKEPEEATAAKRGKKQGGKKPEVKVPEVQYENKERVKKSIQPLKFTVQNFALAPQTRRDFRDVENKLVQEDTDILEQKQLRNNLEAYSYEMRSNLESYGTFEKYLDEETKKTFIAEINVVVDWIYGEGENAPLAEYKTKLAKFKQIGQPVKDRHFYYSELDLYFSQFEDAKKNVLARADTTLHITDEQVNVIKMKVDAATAFFDNVKKDRESKQLYENPAFNLNQIISTASLLKSEAEAVFAAVKPPAPKVEEPVKAEDAKMEDAEKPAEETKPEDAEMKDEAKPEEKQ